MVTGLGEWSGMPGARVGQEEQEGVDMEYFHLDKITVFLHS